MPCRLFFPPSRLLFPDVTVIVVIGEDDPSIVIWFDVIQTGTQTLFPSQHPPRTTLLVSAKALYSCARCGQWACLPPDRLTAPALCTVYPVQGSPLHARCQMTIGSLQCERYHNQPHQSPHGAWTTKTLRLPCCVDHASLNALISKITTHDTLTLPHHALAFSQYLASWINGAILCQERVDPLLLSSTSRMPFCCITPSPVILLCFLPFPQSTSGQFGRAGGRIMLHHEAYFC